MTKKKQVVAGCAIVVFGGIAIVIVAIVHTRNNGARQLGASFH